MSYYNPQDKLHYSSTSASTLSLLTLIFWIAPPQDFESPGFLGKIRDRLPLRAVELLLLVRVPDNYRLQVGRASVAAGGISDNADQSRHAQTDQDNLHASSDSSQADGHRRVPGR